ncbi:MAG: acyltransferase [Gammaproteobacteria bacterium]|nr:acyltransferase [Gammaproteobacteria bacterium]
MNLLRRLHFPHEKYPALTGVRALGATAVFFDHIPLLAGTHVVINVMAFFYVLSGFLIVRIYYEQAEWRREWLAKYFVNRFARIYPVYFLLLTIAVALHHEWRPALLLSNYTLTHALFHGATLLIQASWSLTVEETFYFLAPLFMLLARRRGNAAPLILGFALLAIALGISTLGFRFLGTPLFVFSTTFFGHFLEFLAGLYLARWVMRLETRGPLRLPGRRYTLAGSAGVLVLILVMVAIYAHEPLNHYAIVLVNNFLIPAPIAVLYLGLLREDTALARLLSTPLAGLLGRASYSFYLLQGLIVPYLRPIAALPGPYARLTGVIAAFAALWLVAVLLFTTYEEPLNRLIRQRFRSQDRSVGMRATLFRA